MNPMPTKAIWKRKHFVYTSTFGNCSSDIRNVLFSIDRISYYGSQLQSLWHSNIIRCYHVWRK